MIMKTFREGTCPRCHENIQVPDDRETILCMYCGEEISVKEALGEEEKAADPAILEEYLERVQNGLEKIVKDCDKPMTGFKRNVFEQTFDLFYKSCGDLFGEMEYVYQNSAHKGQVLQKLAEHFTETAKKELDALKFRGHRNQRQLDYNFLITVYLIPAMGKYRGGFSEPFSDCLLAVWNNTFQAKLGKASYEDIVGGFRKKLCYITTAVCESLGKGQDCRELKLLKDYRDQYLDTTPEGHALVEEYYDIAPTIVKRIGKQPDCSRLYEELYQEYLLPCIRRIEAQEYEACRVKYEEMVLDLKARYIEGE